MEYDPVKDRFGDLVAHRYWPTRILFGLLHLFFLRAWYVRRALKQVLSPMRGAVKMLDAGTGFGQFSYWALRQYPNLQLDAVDIKEDYLLRARTFFDQAGLGKRASFSIDDLRDLQTSGPYDLILSVDVMEHILEDVRVFEHFYRVLRPGGSLIINTPSDQGGSDTHEGKEEGFIAEHVRDGYGIEEILEKLDRAGLQVDTIDYTYGKYGSLAWRISIKWPMLMLSASFFTVLILPFYYLVVLPLAMILNTLDVSSKNETGTGLIVVAHRP